MRWKEHHDVTVAHNAQAERLRSEMAFRIRQFDSALKVANDQIALAEKAPEPNPEDFLKAKKTLNISIQAVPVVVRLGGLGEIPGDLTNGSWVRFRDIDVQPNLLPFDQGYKSKDYNFETLADLAFDIERLKSAKPTFARRSELQADLDALQDSAYKLVNFATFRANTEYPIVGQPITSMHSLATQYKKLLKPIQDDWVKVKGSQLIGDNPSE